MSSKNWNALLDNIKSISSNPVLKKYQNSRFETNGYLILNFLLCLYFGVLDVVNIFSLHMFL